MSAPDTAPRRLHPAAAAIDFLRRAPASWGSITAIILVSSRDIWFASAVAGGFAFLSALLAVARWRSFTYRLDAQSGLVIDQGLLRRSRRSIPAERIEDVSTEQGPLQRLFGLVRVHIETGGGSADEGLLDSVGKAEAIRLHALLLGDGVAAETRAESEIAKDSPLFAMTLRRVLLHGLFGFSLLWLAAILALLNGLERVTDFDLHDLFDLAEREAVARFSLASALAVLALLLILGVFAGVASSVMRDFGFRLTYEDGRFRRTRGLLTRSQTLVANRRIQVGLIRRGWLSGRMGFAALEVQTLGGSDGPAGRHELAPFATQPEIDAVLAKTLLPPFEPQALIGVSRAHAPLWAIRRIAPLAAAVAIAGWLWPLAWFGLLLVPLLAGIGWYQRQHHRYALRSTSLQVISGVRTEREWIAPYPAVQSVMVRRGPLQRWFGVASVMVHTAGGKTISPDILDIRADVAGPLARDLIART